MAYFWRIINFIFGFAPESSPLNINLKPAEMEVHLYQLKDEEVNFIHNEAEKSLLNTREIADKLAEKAKYFLSVSFIVVGAILTFFEINIKIIINGATSLEGLIFLISFGFLLLAMLQFFKALRLHKLGHIGAQPNQLAFKQLSEPHFANRKLATMKFAQYRMYQSLILMNLKEVHRKSFYIQLGQLCLFISLLLFVSQYFQAARQYLLLLW